MAQVRYTKHNDQWCISSEVPFPLPNMQAQVSKADGSSKTETVGELVARTDGRYPKYIYTIVRTAPAPVAKQQVGDLSGLLAMFNKAKEYMKFPKILLSLDSGNVVLRLSVAGPKARIPGSINVTSSLVNGDEGRDWFGRILQDGSYEPYRALGKDFVAQVTKRLQELASEPAKVAAAYGKLSGVCCFCNRALGEGKDRRSVAVGYGPDCAEHFGLPWGEKHSFVAEEVQRPERADPQFEQPELDTSDMDASLDRFLAKRNGRGL